MRQSEDACDARGHSINYQEFDRFRDPPLAAQWRVLDRLETAIAHLNRETPPPAGDGVATSSSWALASTRASPRSVGWASRAASTTRRWAGW